MFEIGWMFVLGLIIGSFIAALTYRVPEGLSIMKGRSFCPKCRKKIEWFDNIPVISFFLLGRKCRNCKSKISPRYPLIEFLTAIVFSLTLSPLLISFSNTLGLVEIVKILFVIILNIVFISIFVIDMEKMIIPDEFVFTGVAAALLFYLFQDSPNIYIYILAGLVAALFFAGIYFVTKGRGMGLGDAKLALLMGIVLGSDHIFWAVFYGFVIGSVYGITMLLLGKAKMKSQIPFGPFLVIGFYLAYLNFPGVY